MQSTPPVPSPAPNQSKNTYGDQRPTPAGTDANGADKAPSIGPEESVPQNKSQFDTTPGNSQPGEPQIDGAAPKFKSGDSTNSARARAKSLPGSTT
jgi:hypothetical protein